MLLEVVVVVVRVRIVVLVVGGGGGDRGVEGKGGSEGLLEDVLMLVGGYPS